MKRAARVLAFLSFTGVGAAQASADPMPDTWLECSVSRTAVQPDGTSRDLFSMTMMFAYDSEGNVWTYFPSSQRLNLMKDVHVDANKISWLASQLNGQPPKEGEQPTTIDLGSGEYHGTITVHAGDGSTTTQVDSGQCQATAARSVVSD